ncbi:hypothetical protein HYV88_05990 [Candidatus Woesearchaeota archaeon]|nr:hypothetical protein [Candidatus Woesearchaeota archaeon]
MNKKYFLILVIFFVISSVYADRIYSFNFNYGNGKITLKNVSSFNGYSPNIKEGDHSFLILNENNEVLNKLNFKMNDVLEIVPTDDKEGKHLELRQFNFTIVSNYNKKFSKIRIEKNNEVLFEEDVSQYINKEETNYWLYLIIIILIIAYLVYKRKY